MISCRFFSISRSVRATTAFTPRSSVPFAAVVSVRVTGTAISTWSKYTATLPKCSSWNASAFGSFDGGGNVADRPLPASSLTESLSR